MEKYDYVVLGAGVAGLAFAKRMSENGNSVLLIEKEKQVGGLSRTIEHKGFLLDFCAHRFHTNNKELLDEVLSLPGLKMDKHWKKSRIYMFNKYLKYPFEIQNLLRAMPVHKSFICGTSFMFNTAIKRFKKKDLNNYRDWFVYFYGLQLYKVMCYPYTSKIWRMDPSKLSADWANQRFQGEKMAKLIKRILKKIFTFDFSSYSLEDDELAPDGGIFYYPEKGIQELPDAMAKFIKVNKGKIETSAEIKSVSKENKTVEYKTNNKKNMVKYDRLVSTIPLQSFYHLQEKRDERVKQALDGIKYMDIIFVYAFLNTERISNDHWLYFPDSDIMFNRAVEFSNWSDKMCPEGKTSVCFDITCYDGDETWNTDDETIAKKTIEDAHRIKYFDKADVESYKVFRLRYAYPVYDLEYKSKLDKIVKFLETDDCYLLGRTGIFRYNNSDNSIEMAFALAENMAGDKENKSIFEYTIKEISY